MEKRKQPQNSTKGSHVSGQDVEKKVKVGMELGRERKKAEKQAKFYPKVAKVKVAGAAPAATSKTKEMKARRMSSVMFLSLST